MRGSSTNEGIPREMNDSLQKSPSRVIFGAGLEKNKRESDKIARWSRLRSASRIGGRKKEGRRGGKKFHAKKKERADEGKGKEVSFEGEAQVQPFIVCLHANEPSIRAFRSARGKKNRIGGGE